MPLTIAVQLLPTATAQDAAASGGSSQANVTLTDAVVRTEMGTKPNGRLLKTPTSQLAVNGGSQHPDKRKAGGHGPTLADEVEHLLPTPMTSDAAHPSDGDLRRKSPGLRAIDGLLPTPKAGDADFGTPRTSGRPPEKSTHLMTRMMHTLPTPRATRGGSGTEIAYAAGGERSDEHRTQGVVEVPEGAQWGPYAAAIERWEQVLGRPAPVPTEAGPKVGQRLSSAFVEWMMGLPEGWVTGVDLRTREASAKALSGVKPASSRTTELRILGNGVVTLQAIHALERMGARR